MARAKKCSECGKTYATYYMLNKHRARCRGLLSPPSPSLTCQVCNASFARQYNLNRHLRLVHNDAMDTLFSCGVCASSFQSRRELEEHREIRHQAVSTAFIVSQTAHAKKRQILRLQFPSDIRCVQKALFYAYPNILTELKRLASIMKYYRATVVMNVEFIKLSPTNEIEQSIVIPFRAPMIRIGYRADFEKEIVESYLFIESSVLEFLHRGSGWIVSDLLFMDLEVGQCKPLAGGSCGAHSMRHFQRRGYILMPSGFYQPEERGVAETENQDCFYLAVAKHFVKSDERTALRAFIDQHMTKSCRAPVRVSDVAKFEEANAHLSIAINILFRDEKGLILPVRPSPKTGAKHTIVLMLLYVQAATESSIGGLEHEEGGIDAGESDMAEEEEGEAGGGECSTGDDQELHYVLLEDPDDFLSKRGLLKTTGYIRKQNLFTCYQCFNSLWRASSYDAHIAWCHQNAGQIVKYPEEGETLKFELKHKGFMVGYTIFFDFEALQKEPKTECSCPKDALAASKTFKEASEEERELLVLDEEMRKTWERKRFRKQQFCTHRTKVIKEQTPYTYYILVMDRDGKVVERRHYCGEDAGAHFCDTMLELDKLLMDKLAEVEQMKLTAADYDYLASKPELCCICHEQLDSDLERTVRDHDHISGKFMGLAHNGCNLRRSEQKKIIAFSHNFSGYDSHMFLTELGKKREKLERLEAIPLNTQKFKCLRVNNILYLDSLAFCPDSLEKLTETLRESDHAFPILEQWQSDPAKKALLIRKGVYPYSLATGIEDLTKMVKLPDIKQFTNDIGNAACEPEDYEHAVKVWNTFDCKNMMEYTELYLKSDVYLLAEVVTQLRNSIHREFGLDISHYLSLPMLSKDLMLKMTGEEVELISDMEMSNLLQRNIRGGVSFINTRYFEAGVDGGSLKAAEEKKASEKHATAEEKEEASADTSLLYLDANNLYGKAMSMPLPLRDFEWMEEEEVEDFTQNWQTLVTEEDGDGYIIEATLRYPEKLHEAHSSFPLAPEHVDITEDMLSPYATDCLREIAGKTKHKAKKLTATFNDRKKYLLHGLNLKFYLEQGMELITVHRGIKFYQKKFIKPYIDLCTLKRAMASTKSSKDMFKLLCNSLYGKFIENIMSRMDCLFNFRDETVLAANTHPLNKGFTICAEDLSVSFQRKKRVKMNQSFAVGFSILELSKLVMQRLYYGPVKARLNNDCSVLMSDTDSWVLAVREKSPDAAVAKLGDDLMDCSNYEEDHKLFSKKHKSAVGFLKNEIPKDEITKFVGIRSKSYAFETRYGRVKKPVRKCKGIVKAYVDKISFDEYLDCLRRKKKLEVDQVTLQSKDHVMRLLRGKRIAFSSFDDKRYLLCPTHSVPYGSRLIAQSLREGGCYFCSRPKLLV